MFRRRKSVWIILVIWFNARLWTLIWFRICWCPGFCSTDLRCSSVYSCCSVCDLILFDAMVICKPTYEDDLHARLWTISLGLKNLCGSFWIHAGLWTLIWFSIFPDAPAICATECWVAGMSYDTNEIALKDAFSQHGDVVEGTDPSVLDKVLEVDLWFWLIGVWPVKLMEVCGSESDMSPGDG